MLRDILGTLNTFFTALLAACAVMYIPASVRSIFILYRHRYMEVRWRMRMQWLFGTLVMQIGLAALFTWMSYGRIHQPVLLNNTNSYVAFPPEWGLAARLLIMVGFCLLMRAATWEKCREACWLAMLLIASMAGGWVAFIEVHP